MLGHCLDLLDSRYLSIVKDAYDKFLPSLQNANVPRNIGGADNVLRNLDCAVIRYLHQTVKEDGLPPFDTVRSVFWEGEPLYPDAGFRTKNHIQVCVVNPECIRGYFIPAEDRKDKKG